MIDQTSLMAQMPVGGGDMNALRRAARENSPEAMKVVAQQFEALLMNMVLKSMREATPQSGLFDNNQTKLYTSLLDQQISQNFAKRGVGLADALLRQLSPKGQPPAPADASPDKMQMENWKQVAADTLRQQQLSLAASLSQPASPNETDYADNLSKLLPNFAPQPTLAVTGDLRASLAESLRAKEGLPSMNKAMAQSQVTAEVPKLSGARSLKPAHVREFQAKLGQHAEEASRATGIPAQFLLGQAALESGWGKHVMTAPDGTSSHNLFGIKATKGWQGKVVETTTTEYINGVAYRRKEKFRAYDSYADSFKDYARLLQSNPRYKNVLANANDASSFAQGLQRAGYATDPRYAAKLTSIIQRSFST